jgi:hypothetical protein
MKCMRTLRYALRALRMRRSCTLFHQTPYYMCRHYTADRCSDRIASLCCAQPAQCYCPHIQVNRHARTRLPCGAAQDANSVRHNIYREREQPMSTNANKEIARQFVEEVWG